MGEKHLVANDGSDWTTKPSPVDLEAKIKADKELDDHAGKTGQGPAASNGR